MSPNTGSLDLTALAAHVESGQIDTVICAFPDMYGRLMGKRFDAQFFLESIAESGTHACDYLLTTEMEMEPVPGYEFANWDRGYGDVHLSPDMQTLRIADWLETTAIVICDVQDEASHERVAIAPRSLLKAQIERLASLGLTTMAGSEVEYYLFGESYEKATRKRFHNLHPAGHYLEDYHILQGTRIESFNQAARRHLAASGIPVECTKGEWGLGQHELNLRYSEVLEMADRHTLYKQCLKELAIRLGQSVTFMAKFDAERAGSSCHIHVSLWRDHENAFRGDTQLGRVQASDLFRWFLGGWIKHAADLMVFFAPTVNSYKRYQSSSWAPTRLAWSHDNRTAGFRVVGSNHSLRIECRIPGADCNPYLAYTAALMAGLAGIEQQLEPPPIFSGNAYVTESAPHVPRTLNEAIARFDQSSLARNCLGDNVVEHYAHFFRTEQADYDRAVTDWERVRYFERI